MTMQHHRLGMLPAVLALAMAWLTIPDHAVTAADTIPNVPAALDQAHVIHVKGRQYFPGQKQENGAPLPPVEIDTWIDRQTGRTRQAQVGMSGRSQMSSQGGARTSTTVTVVETICEGTCMMTINHAAKTVTFSRISDYYRDLTAHRLSQKLWSQLRGQATPLENFVKVGREILDGNSCDVWQLDVARTPGDGLGAITMSSGGFSRGGFRGIPGFSMRSKLWLSADNGRLVRAQALSRMQGGSWELQTDYQTIKCDGEIPADVFATEPPAGYTATNSKATAPAMDLRRGGTGATANRVSPYEVQVAFTLADGSVVVGWQSSAGPGAGSQEPLFAKLTFGGPLPKLPLEIYGLRPTGPAGGITYTGRHLGYTRKADRFTEWSLYVPTGTPPAIVKQAGYNALYRFNPDSKSNAQFGFTVEYGVPIKTPEDFDKWVRGAMAELSDNNQAPEPLTYQKVTELAQRLRSPAKL